MSSNFNKFFLIVKTKKQKNEKTKKRKNEKMKKRKNEKTKKNKIK